MLLPKPARDRNEAYLAWIRTQSCLIHGSACRGVVEAAHLVSVGAGGSDFSAVPLCGEAHRTDGSSLHRLGFYTFQDRHKINLYYEAWRLVVRYVNDSLT